MWRTPRRALVGRAAGLSAVLTALVVPATLAGLAACAESAAVGPDAGAPPAPAIATVDRERLAAAPPPSLPPPIDCAALPPAGPCSLACDRDALIAAHVPPGTCAQFRCEIAGELYRIGGCNPAR